MLRFGKSRKLQALAVAAGIGLPAVSVAQSSAAWTALGGGNFHTSVNWTPGVPGGSTAPGNGVATFPTYAGTPGGTNNITVNGAVTLGGINFTGPFGTSTSYSLNPVAGPGPNSTITFTQQSFTFGSTVNVADGTVTIAAPVIGPTLFTKAGSGALILQGTNSFTFGLVVNSGRLVMSTPAALSVPITVGTGNGAILETNGGGIGIVTLASAGAGDALINSSGVLTTGHVFIAQNSTIRVDGGAISINGGIFDSNTSFINGFSKAGVGVLTANRAVITGSLNVVGGTLNMRQQATANSTPGTSRLGGLSIAGGSTPTATLDLNNNIAIVDTPDLSTGAAKHAQYAQQLAYANHNFAWDRPGITSTTAKNTFINTGVRTAIGMIWNNDGSGGFLGLYGNGTNFPQFYGNSVTQNSILMLYTFVGDSDLNGLVNVADFDRFENGFGGSAPYNSWAFGDFDYDGLIDGGDFELVQYGFSYSNPSFGHPLAYEMEAFANANSLTLIPQIAALVPEPSTAGLITAASMMILRRRKRPEKS